MKPVLLFILLLLVVPISAVSAFQTTIWERAASQAGAGAWDDVKTVSFTWTHVPTARSRSYMWDVSAGEVTVKQAGKAVSIPTSGVGLDDADEVAAHKAFINDTYWSMFDLRAVWDTNAKKSGLGEIESPFGRLLAYRVTYPSAGGYTPGDHYVVYLGADGRPVGWAYHPGGASEAKLFTTRGRYQQAGPLNLPTLFQTPGGETTIEITNLTVTTESAADH